MKSYALRHSSSTAVLALVIFLVPLNVQALTATAGWTRADVGLHNKGDGIFLGVSQRIAWDNPVFDASYGLEYVQKKGSQLLSLYTENSCLTSGLNAFKIS